ncbi:phosphonate ABC transporter substrate-binding protein [Pseudodesulfovibrio cashew]|nr:phosphonate ABC transporter substrate-binding protein [Pseudodesulfovibrio cashew]
MKYTSLLRTFALTIALLTSLTFRPGDADANPGGLTMGFVAADSKELTLERWQPILDDLSKELGIPVRSVVLDDYAGIIWHLAMNKAQMAWVGNKAALEAVDRADCEIMLQVVNARTGNGYYSHLITSKDSPLNSVQDVLDNAAHLTFGNGDPNSTSGFVVPGYYIFARRGLDPKTLFKRVVNNNHEKNFHAVANGTVDVATNNSMALVRYQIHYPDQRAGIKIIWTSPLIPSDPIVVRRDLDPALRQRIETFLSNYGKKTTGKSDRQTTWEKQILAGRDWAEFAPSDNSQLAPIRKLELFKMRMRIQKDDTIPSETKEARLQEIDTRLKELEQ